MISWLIFVALIIVLLTIGLMMDNPNNDGCAFRVVGGSISMIIITASTIQLYLDYNEPKAIDVYRGNTELQIKQEIVNDKVVSTDSIVVWKK